MRTIIAFVIIQNFVIGQIQDPAEEGLDLFNNMMKYLFDNCRSEFGTIGFWGNDRIFLADNEADFVLLNDSEVFISPPTRRIKFLVEIYEELNHHAPKIDLFEAAPTPKIETLFIFEKSGHNPATLVDEFTRYQTMFHNCKVYYCFEWKGQIIIVTLNSYADYAPALWMRDPYTYLFVDDDNNPVQWWVYRTLYKKDIKFNHAGSQLCENIFFDRAEKLNGYTIRAAAQIRYHVDRMLVRIDGLITKVNDTREVNSILALRDGLFSKVLTDYLNVSIEIWGSPINDCVRTWYAMLIKELDISLTPLPWTDHNIYFDVTNYLHLTYPFHSFHEQIVTHNRGLASPLEKMFEFYGWVTIIATIFIFLSVFIVIYLSNSVNNSKLSFAVFECLRLLINSSIYTQMNTAKMRIFFSVIFLYFLIIQATFSGHLAAFLTKPVYRKNVETLEDLEDPRYTKIYAREGTKDYLKNTSLYNKTIFDDYNCEKHIENTSVACIDDQYHLEPLIATYNLHTPKNFVKLSYATLTLPHNSALKRRVNNLVGRLGQSGILDVWNRAWEELSNKNATYHLKKMEDFVENYHRPIKLEDVTFAFFLLGIGLFFAIICFIVEYFLKICMLNKTKMYTLSSEAKRFTIHIGRFIILGFCRLLKG